MSVFVVMLRAIGPVTHKVMSMAQWREAAAAAGFGDPQTYVATGNMIVTASGSAAEVTQRTDAIVQQLGLGPGNKAVVRTPRQLQALLRADPFPEASATRPGAIGVYFFAGARPTFDWVVGYPGPERIHIAGRHLIIDYADRVSGSSLPGIVERKSGLVTARNWNTLRALAEQSAGRRDAP